MRVKKFSFMFFFVLTTTIFCTNSTALISKFEYVISEYSDTKGIDMIQSTRKSFTTNTPKPTKSTKPKPTNPPISNDKTQILLVSPFDSSSNGVKAVQILYTKFTDKGYKVTKLIGKSATKSNYSKYLSSPNCIALISFSHGCTKGISLADGLLNSSYFSSNTLSGKKVLYFSACLAFNDPFKSAVIKNPGVQKLIAAIPTVNGGRSAEVCISFWDSILSGQPLTKTTLQNAEKAHNYLGKFDIGGDGSTVFPKP